MVGLRHRSKQMTGQQMLAGHNTSGPLRLLLPLDFEFVNTFQNEKKLKMRAFSICLPKFYIKLLRFLHILEMDLKRIATFYRGGSSLYTLVTDLHFIADFLFLHILSTDFMYLCSTL